MEWDRKIWRWGGCKVKNIWVWLFCPAKNVGHKPLGEKRKVQQTRMATRFLVDETDRTPQDFECCTFDHSDNSPYVKPEILKILRTEQQGRTAKYSLFWTEINTHHCWVFRWTKRTVWSTISSQAHYDHSDISPCIYLHISPQKHLEKRRELRDIYFSMIAEKACKIKVFRWLASKRVFVFEYFTPNTL